MRRRGQLIASHHHNGESDKLVFIKEIINEPSLTGQAKPLPGDF